MNDITDWSPLSITFKQNKRPQFLDLSIVFFITFSHVSRSIFVIAAFSCQIVFDLLTYILPLRKPHNKRFGADRSNDLDGQMISAT